MESEVRETVSCPHCGGEIKAAAKVCKHCRREVSQATEGKAATTAPPSTSRASEAVRDLRALIVSRGVLPVTAFDALAINHPDADVVGFLGHLCAAGQITSIQVESLREAFRERQLAQLATLLDAAVARALLGASHAQAAKAGFEQAIFQQSPAQYLVSAQYLTTTQVQALGGDRQTVSARMRDLWLRLRNDPELRQPVLTGPVAMAVLVVVFVAVVWNIGPGVSDWWSLVLLAPVGAVLRVVWPRSTLLGRVKWAGGTLAAGAISLMLLTFTINAVRPPPPLAMEPRCTMNFNGRGECVFTNLHARPASGCGQILVTCTPRNGTQDSRESESICSGLVSPGLTRRMDFTVAEFDRIRNRAVPWGGDWRDYCHFTWTPQ